MRALKDQACIVGGETAYTRGSGKSVLRLVLEAAKNAIDDAGLAVKTLMVLSCRRIMSTRNSWRQIWASRICVFDLGLHGGESGGSAAECRHGRYHGYCHQCLDPLWLEWLFRHTGEPPGSPAIRCPASA